MASFAGAGEAVGLVVVLPKFVPKVRPSSGHFSQQETAAEAHRWEAEPAGGWRLEGQKNFAGERSY